MKRDLALLPDALSGSTLAASGLALAAELDRAGNSATSKSMCAKSLQDVMRELRELAPPAVVEDELDAKRARRARRLDGRSAASS